MKILAIDYGHKRIGLAISDETQTLARELTILSPKEFWKSINHLIINHKINLIVLGWPLNMKGEETQKTKEVAKFKVQVESKTGLLVEIMDERFSTVQAKKIAMNEENLDSLAAQILLQNYLGRLEPKNG